MMIALLILITAVIITLLLGKLNIYFQFRKEVKALFAQQTVSDKIFSYTQLVHLPEPVQRYFKHVLKDGQPYISFVRLIHGGQFKVNLKKNWVDISGEQYFTTETPGFIWKGVTNLFIARDMYIAGKGRLVATILALINVANASGEQCNQGELLRWLSESIWFPTNLLPSKNLQWEPIDSSSAKLTFCCNGLSLFYIVSFNVAGEIIQMETRRYMDSKRLETWIIKPSGYENKHGFIIPLKAEVLWRLKEGDFSYAKFTVSRIEYNKPEIFKRSDLMIGTRAE